MDAACKCYCRKVTYVTHRRVKTSRRQHSLNRNDVEHYDIILFIHCAEFNRAQNVRDPLVMCVYNYICELISISDRTLPSPAAAAVYVVGIILLSSHRIVSDRKRPTGPAHVLQPAACDGGRRRGDDIIVSAAAVDNEFGRNLSSRVTVRERRRRRLRRHLLRRHFMLFDGDKCTYVIGSDGFVRVPSPSRLSPSLRRSSYFIHGRFLTPPPPFPHFSSGAIFGR